MTSMAAEPKPASSCSLTLSTDHLVQLARTFEEAIRAIWVYDRSGRCVYRNRLARESGSHSGTDSLHEIVDWEDRPLGRLRIREN